MCTHFFNCSGTLSVLDSRSSVELRHAPKTQVLTDGQRPNGAIPECACIQWNPVVTIRFLNQYSFPTKVKGAKHRLIKHHEQRKPKK